MQACRKWFVLFASLVFVGACFAPVPRAEVPLQTVASDDARRVFLAYIDKQSYWGKVPWNASAEQKEEARRPFFGAKEFPAHRKHAFVWADDSADSSRLYLLMQFPIQGGFVIERQGDFYWLNADFAAFYFGTDSGAGSLTRDFSGSSEDINIPVCSAAGTVAAAVLAGAETECVDKMQFRFRSKKELQEYLSAFCAVFSAEAEAPCAAFPRSSRR